MHNFIFQHPGMGSFGIFRDISRQDGIAAPAYRHVERWPGPARILKARRKPDAFDELFGLRGRFYMSLAVALPMRVTVLFDRGWKHPESQIRNFEISNWTPRLTVQFKISNFGFEIYWLNLFQLLASGIRAGGGPINLERSAPGLGRNF